MAWQWIEVSEKISFPIDKYKCYGPVIIKGKKYWRNYKRQLKTKYAMSFLDLLELKIKRAQDQINDEIIKGLY